MKRATVYIYQKEPEGLKFLRSFFRAQRDYATKFFRSTETLKAAMQKAQPDILILESPQGLMEVAPKDSNRVLALVSRDITKGLKAIVRHNVEYYMLAPFHRESLQYKLRGLLERRAWLERLYRERRDLEAIVELVYLISSTLDPKEVLYFVVRKISELIKVTRCSMLSQGFTERRYAYVVSSHEDPSIRDIRIDLRKYPEIRKALQQRRPVVVQDAMKDPVMEPVREVIKPLGIKSIVVIPIIFRDEVIGSLFLRTSRKGHRFTQREIRLLNSIANASANALYNAFLFEKLQQERARLQKMAITDYLTGVYNIRYLYHRLEEEFQRAERYQSPLSCIMFDIDLFKKINDRYGHRVGDLVLREFAQLIRRHTRRSDIFARYGGEEFILLLPQTASKGALTEARRLSALVRQHSFKNIAEAITISMGVATYPHRKVHTPDDLITLADNALFRAKASGRNKVVLQR
jgi:two-component system cell cycle response regulator